MDPLTQAVVGSALPTATRRRRNVIAAAAFGTVGGLLPDIDVFIRSETDTLLYIEYHRHFTHSFAFIPVGGLIAAGAMHFAFRRWHGLTFMQAWLFSTLGYATHGLLDTATSYGTMLFWPFSDQRFSWSIISVIDPLFTLPLLFALIASLCVRSGAWARFGLIWALGYLCLGTVQHQSALEMGQAIAQERGHQPVRLEVKPSFANILIWKVVYEADGRYYVDAVRAGLWPMVFPGESIAKLDIPRDFPWLDAASQQARDIERFRWFSQGFVAKTPGGGDRITDVRYSLVPNQVSGLWSIRLDRDAGSDRHAVYETHRGSPSERWTFLWEMLWARPGGA